MFDSADYIIWTIDIKIKLMNSPFGESEKQAEEAKNVKILNRKQI